MSTKINMKQEGEFEICFYIREKLSDFPKVNPDEDGWSIPGLEEKFDDFLAKNKELGVIRDLKIEDHCLEENGEKSWIIVSGSIENADLYYEEGTPADRYYPGDPDEIEGLLEEEDVENIVSGLIGSFLKDAGLTYDSYKTESVFLDDEEDIFHEIGLEENEGPDEDYDRE